MKILKSQKKKEKIFYSKQSCVAVTPDKIDKVDKKHFKERF